MAGTLLGVNQTLRVSGIINASSTATTATLYTVPSNSYAIVNFHVEGGSSYAVTFNAGSGDYTIQNTNPLPLNRSIYTVYLGPGAVVSFSASGDPTNKRVTGVVFTNSP